MLVLSGIDLNPRSAIEAAAATPTCTVIAWETISRVPLRSVRAMVLANAFAGALTRGSIGTIAETAETENTRSYRGGVWLPFLDTYRTMCLAPQPDFRRVLEDVRAMQLAA
jgi:hypothetical protein